MSDSESWAVRVVRGEQYVNGREAGDVIDFDSREFRVCEHLTKQQIAERAFRAGQRAEGNENPGGRKPLVFVVRDEGGPRRL